MAEIRSYTEFWPHYLREHSRPACRAVHFVGTGAALALLAALLIGGALWLLPLVLIAGYGPAWFGHFFVEHNRPTTFRHPFWSLFSDFRMFFMFLAGRLDRELAAAGVPVDRSERSTA